MEEANRQARFQGNPANPELSLGFFGKVNPHPYSNHAYVKTKWRGIEYPTSEHAYLVAQARCYQMHRLADIWESARGTYPAFNSRYNAADPKQVKSWSTMEFRWLRRHPNHPLRKEWLRKREQVMFGIVKAKFEGNEAARRTLLATNQRYLAEMSARDPHWGIGEDLTEQQLNERVRQQRAFHGRNQLGLILMAIRNLLRKKGRARPSLTARTQRYLAQRAVHHPPAPRPAPAAAMRCLKTHQAIPMNPEELQRTYQHFRFQLLPKARQVGRVSWKPAPMPPGVRVMPPDRRTARLMEGQFSFHFP
jgi:ribA/ribD-fused uncharacterized protein